MELLYKIMIIIIVVAAIYFRFFVFPKSGKKRDSETDYSINENFAPTVLTNDETGMSYVDFSYYSWETQKIKYINYIFRENNIYISNGVKYDILTDVLSKYDQSSGMNLLLEKIINKILQKENCRVTVSRAKEDRRGIGNINVGKNFGNINGGNNNKYEANEFVVNNDNDIKIFQKDIQQFLEIPYQSEEIDEIKEDLEYIKQKLYSGNTISEVKETMKAKKVVKQLGEYMKIAGPYVPIVTKLMDWLMTTHS